jgi:hypothetical protein
MTMTQPLVEGNAAVQSRRAVFYTGLRINSTFTYTQ